jgi:hypothetical protein
MSCNTQYKMYVVSKHCIFNLPASLLDQKAKGICVKQKCQTGFQILTSAKLMIWVILRAKMLLKLKTQYNKMRMNANNIKLRYDCK